jgi:hypothetical protein
VNYCVPDTRIQGFISERKPKMAEQFLGSIPGSGGVLLQHLPIPHDRPAGAGDGFRPDRRRRHAQPKTLDQPCQPGWGRPWGSFISHVKTLSHDLNNLETLS